MHIGEMHVWFRQYAQQMGMQNVRAILPEQIDLLINTSITDTVNQLIRENIGITNDRVITDNSKIGQINALRTLYKVRTFAASEFTEGAEATMKRIYRSLGEVTTTYWKVTNKALVTSSKTEYDGGTTSNKKEYDSYSLAANAAKTLSDGILIKVTSVGEEYMFLVDLSINYTAHTKLTNWFPVRIIDDAYLADTLNDFVLRPRLRTPIAVVYNNQLDIYIDELEGGKLPESATVTNIRMSYVSKPAKVQYLSDLGGQNIDCDLPEHMHVDILKHAVDLYRISISGGLQASQQQEQTQQREDVRNNARNEGYAQPQR